MRFLRLFYRVMVGVVLSIGLWTVHDVQVFTAWMRSRLMAHLEVNVLLRDAPAADVEEFIRSVRSHREGSGELSFHSVELISKAEVMNLALRREDLRDVVTLLQGNPFPDVVRITVSRFRHAAFVEMAERLRSHPIVREVIFDDTVVSYLGRTDVLDEYLPVVQQVIALFFILALTAFVAALARRRHIDWAETLTVTLLIAVGTFANIRLLWAVTRQRVVPLESVLWYGGQWLFTLSVLVLWHPSRRAPEHDVLA